MYSVQELTQNFVVTDLEQRLKADPRGIALREIEEDLCDMIEQTEAARKGGMPPEEYQQAGQLLSCLQFAAQAVRRTWNHYHQ